MKQKISNVLKKDIKEFNKVYLSLIGIAILLLAVFGSVQLINNSYALFRDTIKGEKTIEVVVDTLLNKTTVFNYTGDSQEYEVPKDGYYYIEMAGAEGEGDYNGAGAKTSGYIYLEQGEMLYFYVGGTDGYNGGGQGTTPSNIYSGGGATDVRLVSGEWDNNSSLISRIMVAGGGGVESHGGSGGPGGTLYGGDGVYNITGTYTGSIANGLGGTQNSGGAAGAFNWTGTAPTAGSFGKGGTGNSDYGGNGGGGSGVSSGSKGGGAGGSSYISGYAGVNSVEESTTIIHTNQTLHYSEKYFIGGKMLAGQNKGNGYAKITYVYDKPKKKTTKLDNVRYIKNCINDNSTQYHRNYWREIQAIYNGVNVAKGKEITGTVSALSGYEYEYIVDGDVSISHYAASSTGSPPGNTCVTIDLGSNYDLDEVFVSHGLGNIRVEYDNITSVSSDNSSWTEVINEASIESNNGQRINAYTDTYNGYIQDGLVLWFDGYANSGTTNRDYSKNIWKDLSGNNNNVTVSGATWYNNYLSFDGTNDYAYKTSGAIYNISKEHTIEVLVKPKQIKSSFQSIFNTINTGTGVSQYGSLWINSSGVFSYQTADGFSNNAYQSITLTSSDLNKMYLMISVRNDKNYKFYNRANLLDDRTVTWNARTPNSGIFIGGGSPYFFQGEIYSIRVYNKALTEEELLHNYNYDIEKFNLDS